MFCFCVYMATSFTIYFYGRVLKGKCFLGTFGKRFSQTTKNSLFTIFKQFDIFLIVLSFSKFYCTVMIIESTAIFCLQLNGAVFSYAKIVANSLVRLVRYSR